MKFEKERSAGYLANHMARLFAKRLAEQIRDLGLVPGQFPALVELWRKDGQTQKMLVQTLDVEQATIANTLARMERDGFVRREIDPSDGRSRHIHLTPKARQIEEVAKATAMRINEEALSALTPEEREQFIVLMRKVIAKLKRGEESKND